MITLNTVKEINPNRIFFFELTHPMREAYVKARNISKDTEPLDGDDVDTLLENLKEMINAFEGNL